MGWTIDLQATAEPDVAEVYDVIVIGGGPAGLSAALYAGRSGLRTLVLDKSPRASALGMTERIENYPGIPGAISGLELLERLRDQARQFGAEIVTAQVLSSDVTVDPKEVIASTGIHRGRAVIVATGAMARKQTLPGEEAFVGRGVSYCAICDAAFFHGQEVAVIGDNDEAVEEALHLARFASTVHVVLPTGRFKADPELVARLQSMEPVRVIPDHRVTAIFGNGRVEGIRLRPRSGGQEWVLPVGGVFVYLQGNRPAIDYLHGAVSTDPSGCVRVDEQMQTSVPGVFAAGDVLCRRVRQAVLAAADGALAAMAAERYLSGRQALRSQW
ncbi:MAG TPA: FAD-dependent oxidoreductase [Limnochordales bacterium]